MKSEESKQIKSPRWLVFLLAPLVLWVAVGMQNWGAGRGGFPWIPIVIICAAYLIPRFIRVYEILGHRR